MHELREMIKVILISGPSGSGKSTLAISLTDRILLVAAAHAPPTITNTTTTTVTCIHQDDYFTMPFLPYNERKDLSSYESQDGIDWLQMKKSIQTTIAAATERNRYNNHYQHHHHVMIVEGHMLGAAGDMFHDMDTYIGYDYLQDGDGGATDATAGAKDKMQMQIVLLSVLISCPMEICRQRRLSRQSRSDSEMVQLEHYFDHFVWPGFVEFGRPAMQALRNNGMLGTSGTCSTMSSSTTTCITSDTSQGTLTSTVVEISTEDHDSLERNLIHILQSSSMLL
jgi:uridine kinase